MKASGLVKQKKNNARNVAKDMEGKARWKENRTERKRFNLPKM